MKHRRFAGLWTAIVLVGVATAAGADSEEPLTPDEVMARRMATSNVIPESARATYVTRHVSAPRPSADIERQVDAALADMKEALSSVGNKRNLEKFEAEREQMRKEMIADYGQTEFIAVESYWMSGDKRRKEHTLLPSATAGDLSDLKALAESVAPVGQPEMTLVWDGVKAHRFHHVNRGVEAGTEVVDQLIVSTTRPRDLEFHHHGRHIPDGFSLDIFRKQGSPVTVEDARSPEGDEALLLRMGEKDGDGFVLEMLVLPQYGYVLRESVLKMGGVVMSRETCSGYVEAADGIWVPTEISREAYQVSEAGVPVLSSAFQMVAVGCPEFNVDIADDVFTIQLIRRTATMEEDNTAVCPLPDVPDKPRDPVPLLPVFDSSTEIPPPSVMPSEEVDQPDVAAATNEPVAVSPTDEEKHTCPVKTQMMMYVALVLGAVVLLTAGTRLVRKRKTGRNGER